MIITASLSCIVMHQPTVSDCEGIIEASDTRRRNNDIGLTTYTDNSPLSSSSVPNGHAISVVF